MKQRISLAALFPKLVLLLGLGLRVVRLGYQELRGDETFGYFFSLNGPAQILRGTLELREPHPVASYVLQHEWMQLAGHSEFALRFPSTWFGVLSIALTLRLARTAGLGRGAATFAAALLALSPYALWHSQDARMYSMSLALTLGSTCLALAFLARPRLATAAGYVMISLLALHTHYFAAFVILAQDVWFVWRISHATILRHGGGRGLQVWPWVAVQGALAVLYFPWLVVARTTLTGYSGNGDSPGAWDALLRIVRVFAAGEMTSLMVRNAASILVTALLALLVYRWMRRPGAAPNGLGLIALILCVPLAATWLSAQSRPIFNERYLVAAAPGLCILLAAGVDGLRSRPGRVLAGALLAAFLALGLAAAASYLFDPAYSKSRGWRELAVTLGRVTQGFPEGEAWVVANAPDPTLWYYYPQQSERWVLPPTAKDSAGAGRIVEQLEQAGVVRVVVPISGDPGWDDAGIAVSALAQRYRSVVTIPVRGWQVVVAGRAPEASQAIEATFEGGLVLTSAGLQPRVLHAGQLLGVYLKWSGSDEQLPSGTKLTLQLLDGTGAVAGQVDEPLSIEAGWSTHGLMLSPTLSPGSYQLIAALYDGTAPELPRMRVTTGEDFVPLASVSVQ